MKTYSINTIDSETTPTWMGIASAVKPGTQDSGKCRFVAEVEEDKMATLEAALEDDDSVLSYSVVGDGDAI